MASSSKTTKQENGVRLRIAKGVVQLPNGRFQVQVPVAVGAKQVVTRTFRDLHDAKVAFLAANRAKGQGNDVRAALFGTGCATTPHTAAPKAAQRPPCRALGELLDGRLAEMERISAASDHTWRRNTRNGRTGYRPATVTTVAGIFNNHLRPAFGHLRIDEITHDLVQDWLLRLAEGNEAAGVRPIDVNWATSLLIWLRSLTGRANRSELPEQFPWPDAHPVEPKNPRKKRSNPEAWDGDAGDADPVLAIAEMLEFASTMKAADQAAVFCEYLGGPRGGETFGLMLKELSFKADGRLWARIRRQMLCDGTIVEWVKTDASYRRIPLPGVLADYLEEYCSFYHSYDLRNPDRSKGDRMLIVNPAGRDTDGTFLPGRRTAWGSRLIERRNSNSFSHEDLGYHLDAQHFRKSCSTLLLVARDILSEIDRRRGDDECVPEDPEERAEYWRAKVVRLERRGLGYAPMHISAYLGQKHDGRVEQLPANPVTLAHYNLTTDRSIAFGAIADTLDELVRHEIGALHHVPDDEDLLPVHRPDDPLWMTVHEAVEVTGQNRSTISSAILAGTLEGHLAWIADGGWKRNTGATTRRPALPQYVASRTAIEQRMHKLGRMSEKAAAALLGLYQETFRRNFVATGLLTPVDGGIEVESVHKFLREFHDQVVQAVSEAHLVTPTNLKVLLYPRLAHHFHYGHLKQAWVDHWVRQLSEAGRLAIRSDGRIRAVSAVKR